MKRLFPHLAAVNLMNNRTAYFPFLLTGSVCVAMFYIILTFAISPEMASVPYATGAVALFYLGTVIIGVFCCALLFYANSFLIRRRRREFGLYSVLGMEKRHVGIVLFFENLYACAACLALGLVFGPLLGRLLFALLTKLLNFDVHFNLQFCDEAAAASCILFGALFFVLYLYNLAHLYCADPITLLRSENSGEKEPRAFVLLTLAGLVSLGSGYAIAVTCTNAARSIGQFFLAVLLVILGTFCLFTSGSIHLLKALRCASGFYYKPENFIAVSGMLYRMKRNAAGLASVCILFTMLLVTVSTTVCLYLGQESSLNAMYPTAVIASASDGGELTSSDASEAVKAAARLSGTQLERSLVFHMGVSYMKLDGDALTTADVSLTENDAVAVCFLPLSDYNALTGETAALNENECLLAGSSAGIRSIGSLSCAGIARLPEPMLRMANSAVRTVWVVASDAGAALQAADGGTLNLNAYIDVAGGEDSQRTFAQALQQTDLWSSVFCRADVARDWYALYGCFLFLGLFFGVLFLLAMGLILYYKQISEGYDDSRRFLIMQKVGLSGQEARRAISRQILLVFFLPLTASAVHLAFAYNIICNMLVIFGVTDRLLFAALCAATFLLCAAVYFILYRLTSRAYYRLVRA